MTVTQYIGARYVPLFAGDWDSTQQYEPLSIVLYQGNSYTSVQAVPAGIAISNTEYWAQTGNYNAQVEAYRQEVRAFDSRITQNASDISAEETARKAADTALQTSFESGMATETAAREAADTALSGDIAAEAAAREAADTQLASKNVVLESEINAIKAKKFALADFGKLEPFARSSVEIDGVRYSPQGGISFVNNAGDIISAVFLAPAGDSTKNGYLRSFRNNDLVAELNVHLGHGNSMCYHDGYIYIPDNSVANIVYKFPITQTGVLGGRQIGWNSPGGNVTCSPDGRFFMVNYNFIIEIDPKTGTEIMRVNNPQFHVLDAPFHTTTQSVGCFELDGEIYFAYATSCPNLISIVDIEGNFVTQKKLPISAQYIMLAEIENITIDGSSGDFYVQATDNAGDYQTKTVAMFKGNIWSKSNEPGEMFRSSNGQVSCQVVQDPAYVFPKKDAEGEPTATNPVKVYYAQDLSTMIQAVESQSLSIDLNGNNTRKNGIMLGTGFAEVFDQDYTCYTCEFRSCQVMIVGSTMLNDVDTNNAAGRPNVRVINNAILTTYNNWTNANAMYSNRGIICCSQNVDDSLVPGIKVSYKYRNS